MADEYAATSFFDEMEEELIRPDRQEPPAAAAAAAAGWSHAGAASAYGDFPSTPDVPTEDEAAGGVSVLEPHSDLAAEPTVVYRNEQERQHQLQQSTQQSIVRQQQQQQQPPWHQPPPPSRPWQARPSAASTAFSSAASRFIPGSGSFPHGSPGAPSKRGRGRSARGGGGSGARGGRGGQGGAGRPSTSVFASDVAAYSHVIPTHDQAEAEQRAYDQLHPNLDFDEEEMPIDARPPASALGSTARLVDGCLPISTMPVPFRALFKYGAFNRMQSAVFHLAYYADRNLVCAAPTGSGKTVIFEIAMLRFFQDLLLPADDKGRQQLERQQERAAAEREAYEERELEAEAGMIDPMWLDEEKQPAPPSLMVSHGVAPLPKLKWNESRKKALYIAPTKALCTERYHDWGAKFGGALGLAVEMMTGDRDANPYDLARASIVITTPEKWDSLGRRAMPHDRKIMQSIGLVMVDEIHFLNDPKRGATLEGLLSRMQMRKVEASRDIPDPTHRQPIGNLRIIALSATAPNAQDVADWLQGDAFDSADRAVRLEYWVHAYHKPGGNGFAFEHALNDRIFEHIKRYAEGKPVLVFNSTRKNAEQAAKTVAAQILHSGLIRSFVPPEAVPELNAAKLRLPATMSDLLDSGVAFHHAGLQPNERAEIDRLFTRGHLRVLCSTTTLGTGVNLPARLVIVKGTTMWDSNSKKFVELDETTITQMIGRAGRPQHDTKGIAVVMTSDDMAARYSTLLKGRLIESHLRSELIEHVNAEIVIGGMNTTELCRRWLQSTFMYQRMKSAPSVYFGGADRSQAAIEAEVSKIADTCIHQLEQAQLIEYTSPDRVTFCATDVARLAARWYLSFATAQMLSTIPPEAVFEDYLDLFAKAAEFDQSELRLKPGDKSMLNPFLVRHRERARARTDMQTIAAHPIDGQLLPHQQAVEQQPARGVLKPAAIPYSVPGRKVQTREDKIKVLTQVVCMGLLEDACKKAGAGAAMSMGDDGAAPGGTIAPSRKIQSIRNDQETVLGNGARIAQAICDYMLARASRQMEPNESTSTPPADSPRIGWVALKHALVFRKAIVNRAFPASRAMYGQLKGVGPVGALKLFDGMEQLAKHQHQAKAQHTFANLATVSEHCLRQFGFGSKATQVIQSQARSMPAYVASVSQQGYFREAQLARCFMSFDCTNKDLLPRSASVHLLAGSLTNELLYYRCVKIASLPISESIDVEHDTQIQVSIIDDKYVGCDVDACAFVRYGDAVSTVLSHEQEVELQREVEAAFAEQERRKVDSSADAADANEEDLGQLEEPIMQAIDPDAEFAPPPTSMKEEGGATTHTRKGHCKHPAPKCLQGACKHVCCKARALDLAASSHPSAASSAPRSWFSHVKEEPDELDEGFIAPDQPTYHQQQRRHPPQPMDLGSDDWPQPFGQTPMTTPAYQRKRRASSFLGDFAEEADQLQQAQPPYQMEYDAYFDTQQQPPQMQSYHMSTPLASNRRVGLPTPSQQQQQMAYSQSRTSGYFAPSGPSDGPFGSEYASAAGVASAVSFAPTGFQSSYAAGSMDLADELSAYALPTASTPAAAFAQRPTPAMSTIMGTPAAAAAGSRWSNLKEEETADPYAAARAALREKKAKRARAMQTQTTASQA